MTTASQQQLDDLMECLICNGVYRDPRSLPFCQHSFCLVCCERFCRNKRPGASVECPLCREPFTIPPSGVRSLRKNFVLEKLNQLDQPSTGSSTGNNLTGMKTLVTNFCDKHTTKTLDWYCFACREAICSTCLTQIHRSHDYRNLEEVTNELQAAVKTGVTDLQKVYEKCKLKLDAIEKEGAEFMKHIDRLEAEIKEDAKRLQTKIEQSKSKLLAEVSAKKRERLKEVDNAKKDVHQQMALLSSLMNYTTELLKSGTSGDVAREAKCLEKRKDNLLQCNYCETSIKELGTLTVAYTSREAELKELGKNLVGSLTPLKVKAVCSLPNGNSIHGLTVLNKELYVHHANQGIVVYDTDTYNERRRLEVPGLESVSDMTSCQRYRCIYISDRQNKVIHKVRVETIGSREQCTQWAVDDEPFGLSINSDYNLIVTCSMAKKIKVFTTDGKLVKDIQLQHADILLPYHTIQLTADKYVVCHGGRLDEVYDPLNRVCIIDGNSKVKRSFGGSEGSGEKLLDTPVRLTVANGMILVVDLNNDRVVMLSPTLRYVRTVLPFLSDYPGRICFDVQTSRLYVDESKFENDDWTTGHVNVYSVFS